jgi:hypothetical protein
MTIPSFTAENSLGRAITRYRLRLAAGGLSSCSAIAPAQSLFPPGTPIYTCSPPCTWGPPMTQTCCAEICFYLPFVGQICIPNCFTRSAPLCPQ